MSEHAEHALPEPVSEATPNTASPLLASILERGWGLTPSGSAWSGGRGALEPELLWGCGLTPFGPYSHHVTPSFALRDAAKRAALHVRAAEVAVDLLQLRDYYAEFGLTIEQVLGQEGHLAFLRRLNVLSYKMDRARSYLSLNNFDYSSYQLQSTRHDLLAMRALLANASATIRSQLLCH